jgi:hypothetical protein
MGVFLYTLSGKIPDYQPLFPDTPKWGGFSQKIFQNFLNDFTQKVFFTHTQCREDYPPFLDIDIGRRGGGIHA